MLEDAIRKGTLRLPQLDQPVRHALNGRDLEIQECLMEFDLLSQTCHDTGEQHGYGEHFLTCPICGHRDCFVVYSNANEPESFYCFGANGNVGGTAIDYFMHTQDLTREEATKYLVHDLCHRPYGSRKSVECKVSDKLPRLDLIPVSKINDKDLGQLFAKTYGNELRYVPDWRSYVFYDGTRWVLDKECLHAKGLCKGFVDALMNGQSDIGDDASRTQYAKNASKYLNERARCRIVDDARTELADSASVFDASSRLLNVANGTIDLDTGKFREHRATDMLTKIAPVRFDANARCERWEQFILETQLGDEDTACYLQKAFGASLCCDTSNELMHILGFETRSGKGVLAGTLEAMLGTDACGYACNSQGDVFEQPRRGNSSSARGNIAMMEGRRLVFAHEPPQGMVLDAAIVKQLTGNDMVTARRLYQDETTFKPTANIFLLTNHMPLVTDRTVLTSGRIVVIPFENHLCEEERDKSLKEFLVQPTCLSGVLNWCLDGLKLYREEGLSPSARVKEATRQYSAGSNVVKNYLDNRIEPRSNGKMQIKDIFTDFDAWCRAFNPSVQVDRKAFRDELELNGLTIKTRGYIEGKECRGVVEGVTFREVQANEAFT